MCSLASALGEIESVVDVTVAAENEEEREEIPSPSRRDEDRTTRVAWVAKREREEEERG